MGRCYFCALCALNRERAAFNAALAATLMNLTGNSPRDIVVVHAFFPRERGREK